MQVFITYFHLIGFFFRHLQEHLDELAEDVKLDTEDDVYFGYFNVHDTNKDGESFDLMSEFVNLMPPDVILTL